MNESGLSFNRTPLFGLDDLDSRLRDVLSGRGDKTLFSKASGSIRYSRVVRVLDLARGAGAERIGLVGVEAAAR